MAGHLFIFNNKAKIEWSMVYWSHDAGLTLMTNVSLVISRIECVPAELLSVLNVIV